LQLYPLLFPSGGFDRLLFLLVAFSHQNSKVRALQFAEHTSYTGVNVINDYNTTLPPRSDRYHPERVLGADFRADCTTFAEILKDFNFVASLFTYDYGLFRGFQSDLPFSLM